MGTDRTGTVLTDDEIQQLFYGRGFPGIPNERRLGVGRDLEELVLEQMAVYFDEHDGAEYAASVVAEILRGEYPSD